MPYHKGKRQHDRGVIPEANKKETAARCAGKREDGDIRPLFRVLLFLLRKRGLKEKAGEPPTRKTTGQKPKLENNKTKEPDQKTIGQKPGSENQRSEKHKTKIQIRKPQGRKSQSRNS